MITLGRCLRLGHCGFMDCICDLEPSMTYNDPDADLIDRLRGAYACTKKTYWHTPDWKDGRKLLDEAIAEIERLRGEVLAVRQRESR